MTVRSSAVVVSTRELPLMRNNIPDGQFKNGCVSRAYKASVCGFTEKASSRHASSRTSIDTSLTTSIALQAEPTTTTTTSDAPSFAVKYESIPRVVILDITGVLLGINCRSSSNCNLSCRRDIWQLTPHVDQASKLKPT